MGEIINYFMPNSDILYAEIETIRGLILIISLVFGPKLAKTSIMDKSGMKTFDIFCFNI